MDRQNTVEIKLNGVAFALRHPQDFSFLTRMGRVGQVFSHNDSGNLSFGVDTGTERLFVKVAGAATLESICTQEQAVENLRRAMGVYEDVRHPALIRLREHYPLGGLYVAVFDWAEGGCLFDHWNFDYYAAHPEVVPPAQRFRALPAEKRLAACQVLFSFLEETARSGYVAVDFYDGSLLYDFTAHRLTICDIDLFARAPAVNAQGAEYPGTKRLKAPEEYQRGAVIDERTNVFTLGALLLGFFGSFTPEEQQRCYEENRFTPCRESTWELGPAAYQAACRAVAPDPQKRFATIREFAAAWAQAKPHIKRM